MKRKSASKKLLPLMLILMLILGISMPANAAANPRLNSTKKVLYVGKTSQLKVVNWKKAVKWSSSNNKVVKVSSKGKITAVKTGTATVKARIAKKTLTCKVTVKSPGMSVKKAVLYVKGKSLQLKVNGVSGKTVWSSANKKIVKVSSKGKITAVKTGTTVVKAKIGKKVYTCKVTVKNPYLSAKSLKFVWGTANTSRKLSIKGDVIKAASSSNTKVAKVKKDGTVSVTGTGTCTVTFKDSKKRTYRCKITVVKPTLKNQKATLEEGESIQLGFKEKGVKVSWSSADQKIATVTKTGVVQAVGEGNTSIVAKVKGIKIFARIFVTKKYVQDSGHEYTRGEWVKLLLDKVGCKYEEQFDSKNYYYADTRENENGIAAEIAKTMGIIPDETDEQDVPYFYPDEYATREFAAYTAVMLMGYETTDEEPTCADAAQIRYKNVVAIALKKNMLSLNGDTFEPEKAINGNDAAQILKAIDQITEDSVIDENYDSKVTYATNVVEVKDTSKNIYNVVQNSDGTYTITVKDGNAYKNLETGKVVLFSAKEMGTDTAFLDRMHCYLPGWEIPKFRPEHFTDDYGFISDYLAEFIRELRKEQYGDAFDHYFRLGRNLNQRDTIAVRRMIDGYLKLLYPNGEFTKEELEEVIQIALEMRRRVKEQLKKLGGMEFYDVNFSYIDLDDMSEHYVSVPEQGGGKLIPDGMCNPGQVYTVSRGKSGMIGVFRLESQMLPGNGKIERTGLGSDSKCKEAVNTAFNYLKANGNRISGSISTSTKDYIINYQDLQGIGMTEKLALPTLVALCSIALGKPVVSNLAILGDITISGTMIKVDELANTLQVCLDSGAKKVLIPSTSFVDFASVPADLMSAFQLIPYQSAEDAVFKALGVE